MRVAFDATVSLYSSFLMDGRYLVDFYLPHPSDFHYNAINKQFWIQYHSHEDIVGPTSSAYTHYIPPSETSETYNHQHHLLTYHKFLNLTQSDTFILGPFNFATIHGCKSCDRIPQSTWDVLKSQSDVFHNPLPCFDVPTYSIHVDQGMHTSCHCSMKAHELVQSAKSAFHTYPWSTPLPLTKSVSDTVTTPIFFFFKITIKGSL